MARKKIYGEETVVVRVPVSKLSDVRSFLEGSKVLHYQPVRTSKQDSPIHDLLSGYPIGPFHDALRKAYRRGFVAGEEYNIAEMLDISGQKHMIGPVMKAFRVRSPNPPSKEFAEAFMHVREDWYKLISSGVNSPYLFPPSESAPGVVSLPGN